MILHQPNQSRGARLGSPELVYIAPKGGITGQGRRAPVGAARDAGPLERSVVAYGSALDDNIAGVRAQGGAVWDVDAT